MRPSEFFALVPELTPDLLDVPEVGLDDNEQAQRIVDALVDTALLDFELLTGQREWYAAPATLTERRAHAAFLCLLTAAALRNRKVWVAMNAEKVHNPDVQQNVAFNLDLVRVIGRAERGTLQRARKLWRGEGTWFESLVTGRAVQ